MPHTTRPPRGESDSVRKPIISTGSMQSHHPPGGGSDVSSGAGTRRNAGGYLLPQPSCSRTHTTATSGIAAPIWLSTSARPLGTGPNLMSSGMPRVTSPPQPPPLPPPPPSPQLVPLKARLARSKSIASPTANSAIRTDQWISGSGGSRRQEPLSVLARRTAFGHGPSKSLRESSSPPDPDHSRSLLRGSSIPSTASAKPSDSVENVPFSTTGVFPPITHSRERNPITVCLASLVFLVVSAVIATVFSTLILPLCLLAALIRRIGLCWANFCWFPSTTLCCRCCRPQRRLINSNNLFHLFIARLYPIPNGDDTEANMTWCRCEPISNPIGPAQTYYALSAAELRWLPPVPTLSIPSSLQQTLRSPYPSKSQYLNCSSLENSMPLYCAENPPLILICLRFGAPGVQLTKLREVIATRLFPFQSTPSSLASSTHESCLSDKFNLGGPGTSESHPRANSLTPPGDALVRLTQCLTCLSTGYAWQPCNAFRIDEHVLPVPATCLSEASDKTTRFVHFTTPDSLRDGCPVPVRVESVVSAISQLPFLIHRPLWQVYLLEKFQDVDGTEPSDAESAAESDDPDSHRVSGSWVVSSQSHNVTQSPARKRPRTTRPMADLKVPSSSGLVCQRSGSAGVGSLLVFRLHAALSDDGKALVHMLTSCLADFPSRTSSPSCTPNRPTAPNSLVEDGTVSGREQTQKRRWRGQIHVDKSGAAQIQGGTSSTDSSDRVISAPGTKSSTKPSVPIRSYTTMANKQARPISTSLSDSGSTSTTDNNNSVNGMNNFGSVTMKSSVHVRGPTATNGESSSLLHSSSTMENGPAESSQIVRPNQSVPLPEDEDPEESEAAQWWYTFWSSSLATIATCCDLVRALLTGPAIILHKYFFTRADMGILTKRQLCTTTNLPSATMTTPEVKRMATTRVYKCALLSLVKLSRVRQVTKASYSEIVLSLLAGGLRAYHQTVGLKHPPDLLSFLSVEVPVLPSCTLNSSQRGSVGQQLGLHRCDGSPCPGISRLIPGSQRFRISQNGPNPSIRHPQSESVVETGLIGNEHRMVAIGTLPTTANTLRPGRHVLADICLPINTEGMLPRLWETRQRLVELNNSVDPLCLAWARTVLYTIMPHPMAGWLEANFGGSSKASVSFTGVEVVSPFSGHPQPKEHDLSATYQMPPTRRLAYMSLLASKSAEARTLRRRLRRRLPRGALVCPPRLGTSFRALARHLTNANAGLVYIAGSPVIRIDTWMPSPRLAGDLAAMQSVNVSGPNTDGMSWALCRDLSVTFTTYAGQLSLTFCANSAMDSHPNLDLILQAMRTQLRKMCRLLAGRHVPTPTDRWLYRSSSMDTRSPSPSTALSLSPSLNPSLVLHTDSNPATDSSNETRISARSVDSTGSYGQFDPGRITVATPVSGGSERINPSQKQTNRSPPFDKRLSSTGREAPGPLNNDASVHSNQALTNQISVQAYACQSGQPTEQLQDRLQWVQQQLNDAASSTPTHPGKKRLTDQELTDLRNEFCALLRELKQRCSLGSLGITPEMAKTVSASLTTSLGSPDHETLSGDDNLNVVHSRSSGFSTSRSGPMKFGLGEMSRTRGVDREPGQTSECSSVASASCGKSIGIKRPSIGLEFGTDTKRTTVTPAGGDFDEDPDFYIDAYGDDEEFEEDEMSDGLEESTEPPFAVQSSGLRARPPVSPLTSERLGGKAPLDSQSTAIRIESMIRDGRDLLPTGADSYRTKSKWRRTSATPTSGARKRRRSSLLSADVASFDLIPTRRGSLGSGGTCSTRPGQDGLLSKLVKRKLGGKSRRT